MAVTGMCALLPVAAWREWQETSQGRMQGKLGHHTKGGGLASQCATAHSTSQLQPTNQ